MYTGRSIPLLQDVDRNGNRLSDVWYESWQVTYRDVVLLDAQGREAGVYNLTDNNLAEAPKYQALKQMILDVANSGPAPSWHNSTNRYDVDGDTVVAPLDVLLIVNELNLRQVGNAEGRLPTPAPSGPHSFFDVDNDGFVAPVDALLVVIELNKNGQSEGEGGPDVSPDAGALAEPSSQALVSAAPAAAPAGGKAARRGERDAEPDSRAVVSRPSTAGRRDSRLAAHSFALLDVAELPDVLAEDVAQIWGGLSAWELR